MNKLWFAIVAVWLMGSGFALAQVPPGVTGPEGYPAGPAVIGAPSVGESHPEGEWYPVAMGDTSRFWAEVDYLLLWIKKGPNPTPLLTTGEATNGLPPGIAGSPTTQVLFGGQGLVYKAFSGVRVGFGFWLDENHHEGVEMRGFLTESRSLNYSFGSSPDGTPPLAFPFIADSVTNREDVQTLAQAPELRGLFQFKTRSRLAGADVNGVFGLWNDATLQLNGLIGYRYFGLYETINIQETAGATAPPNGIPIAFNGGDVDFPNVVVTRDGFRCDNNFHGVLLGFRGETRSCNGRLILQGRADMALGMTQQLLEIEGSTSQMAGPAGPTVQTVLGGLRATQSNIGRHTNTQFTILPSLELRVGAQLTDNWMVSLGYNAMYLSAVIRPGDQIDRRIDPVSVPSRPEFVPGQVSGTPAILFRKSDFWAQGIDLGVQCKF